MDQTIADILEFVEENDVKFIRLAYCDLFGTEKYGNHGRAAENGV
ncbi:MAG: hypothetical protein ACLSB9_14150 [Hydrogeniiclostridium mannosilyticum]